MNGEDWTDNEVVETVESYLTMLRAECRGEAYSKTEHRRRLMALLSPMRTEASVEFKYQNISAVMVELGLPYIRGYLPARNFQGALAAEVRRRLTHEQGLLTELTHVGHPRPVGRLAIVQRPPFARRRSSGRVVDFEVLQAENRRLGALGEQLVVDFERSRLEAAGRPDLADGVRWVAREDGDGIGFDVLSFTDEGNERYVEVKTTSLGPGTPFYLSSAELAFALDHSDSYVIFRVFDVTECPRFFCIAGDVNAQLDLVPVTYRAHLK